MAIKSNSLGWNDWELGQPVYVSDLNDTFNELFAIASWL